MSGTKTDQYARNAKGWSDRQYADPRAYLEHRAQLIVELGPPLVKDDEVLDLACGDGGLGEALLRRGLRYRGIDLEPAMVEAAARRLGARAVVELGDLNTFALPSPVAAITVFRAIYYAVDRPAFFARAREQTQARLRPESEAVPRAGRRQGAPGRRVRADRHAPVLRSTDDPTSQTVGGAPERSRANPTRRRCPARSLHISRCGLVTAAYPLSRG
jgi:SAM-dependent methyltransferase